MGKFHWRGLTSLLLSFSFLVALVSGLVLWLVHPSQAGGGGGGALLFGLGKGAWKEAHIWVSLLMAVAGILHLCLNWSLYWGYVWQRASKGLNQKRELALAVAITAAVFCVSSLGGGGDPMRRLAMMTASDIARNASQPVEQFVAAMEKEGIAIHNPADSLKEIAEHNQTTPQAVLEVVGRVSPNALRMGPPGGPGGHGGPMGGRGGPPRGDH